MAEVTLGYQGWLFILSAARMTGTDEKRASFAYDVAIEGLMPYHQGGGFSTLQRGPDGALYADGLSIFLDNLSLCELVGLRAAVRTTATMASCEAEVQTTVVLAHDSACFQNPDGTIDCSGADAGAGGVASCPDGGS